MATSKTKDAPFTPATPLARLVHAGDFEGAVACISQMSPAERRSHRAALMHMNTLLRNAGWSAEGKLAWGSPPTDEQHRALSAAVLLCGTPSDVAATRLKDDDLIRLAREHRPPALDELADALVKSAPHRIVSAQRLIVEGLAARPVSDEYIVALIATPRVMRSGQTVGDLIAADPGLPAVLLRVFEVEGTAEDCLASSEKYNHNPANSWTNVLLKLAQDGKYSRVELLEKTLGTLERDWPQYRAGWFSRFHDALAPTASEMQPFVERYLGLCQSRIAPTVTLALAALKTLDAAKLVDPSALLAALQPVISSAVKGQVDTALKLLDQIVKRDRKLTRVATSVACAGLVHESAEVQRKILSRLEEWGLDDAGRRDLRQYLDSVAATNRKALLDLAGGGEPARPEQRAPAPAPSRRETVSALDDSRRLRPVVDLDELVDRIAYVFENDTDIDEFERVIEALVRLAPFSTTARERMAPVRKRARKVRTPVAGELARVLIFVLDGERLASAPAIDHGGNSSGAHGVLIRRIDDLMSFAARDKGLSPLSAPTHRRGFIDSAAFVERVSRHQASGAESSVFEQVCALLRLSGDASDDVRARARTLADNAFSRALRYALGDDIAPGPERALFMAAARIRHPNADDAVLADAYGDLGPDGARAARYAWSVHSWSTKHAENTYHHHKLRIDTAAVPEETPSEFVAVLRQPPASSREYYDCWTFAGINEALVRYSATIVPSSLEAFFAEGALAIGNNIDWWEAQWQDKAYLSLLLDPTVPLTPMGALLLALGLGSKEPGQVALSIDALTRAELGGRLDVAMLGSTLRDLLATPLVKAARFRKSLQAAARADEQSAKLVFDLLCTSLGGANPAEPPKDTGTLLELLVELLVDQSRQVPAPALATIRSLQLSGKGKVAQRELLAALGNS